MADIILRFKGDASDLEQALDSIDGELVEIEQDLDQIGSQGTEATDRIGSAMKSLEDSTKGVADNTNLAEQAFEALGGSPAEFLGRAANETERLVILLADAQKNIDQLEEESREGLSGFADRAAKAQQRMRELNDIIEEMGEDAVPEVVDELRRLEKQFDKTFTEGKQRAAQLEASIEDVEDELNSMRQEARRGQDRFTDLEDVVTTGFPKMARSIGAVISAVAVLTASYQGTKRAIEAIDDVTDGMATRTTRSITDLIIKVTDLQLKLFGLEDRFRRLIGVEQDTAAATNTLRLTIEQLQAQGLSTTGTFEQLTARLEQSRRKVGEVNLGIVNAAMAFDQMRTAALQAAKLAPLQEALAGLIAANRDVSGSAEEVVARFQAMKAAEDAAAQGAKSVTAAIKETAEVVEDNSEAFEDLVETLDEIGEAFRETATEMKDSQDDFTESIEETAKAIEDEASQLKVIQKELKGLTKAEEEFGALSEEQFDRRADLLSDERVLLRDIREAKEEEQKVFFKAATQQEQAQESVNQTIAEAQTLIDRFKEATGDAGEESTKRLQSMLDRWRDLTGRVGATQRQVDIFREAFTESFEQARRSVEDQEKKQEDLQKAIDETAKKQTEAVKETKKDVRNFIDEELNRELDAVLGIGEGFAEAAKQGGALDQVSFDQLDSNLDETAAKSQTILDIWQQIKVCVAQTTASVG